MKALKFVILLGIVSLFADITYEGARSITGPYLAILGASGTAVGLIAGFGEFAGYGIRLISGYATDKTRKHWMIVFIGYLINLVAVPLLAFAGSWQMAALLIILERVGKAIRNPARDAMLSFATKKMGRGWGFGIHESLDQTGALLGPLILAFVLYKHEGYREGFLFLAIPAALSLASLFIARLSFPRPQEFERKEIKTKGLSKQFWIFLLASGCVGAGFADFALVAYHFQKMKIVSSVWIPLFYAIAMAIEGATALFMGKMFDRLGMSVFLWVVGISSLFAPFVFLGGFGLGLAGMILWGIGMASQQSIMRAMVANLVPSTLRGSAYGIFGLGFGLLWFIGSAVMGFLYDVSLVYVVIFSMAAQLLSIPIFLRSRH